MNKAKRNQFTAVISDSIAIIRGNAQLALEVDRPKWVDRYLQEIIKESDKFVQFINQTKDLCLNECYSAPVTSAAMPKKEIIRKVSRGVQNE